MCEIKSNCSNYYNVQCTLCCGNYVQCLTSSQPILLKKNLFSKGFTWPKLFQPLWYLKIEILKEHTRHPKLSLKIKFGQIHQLVPEKSESENFTQIWLTRCQTLYIGIV